MKKFLYFTAGWCGGCKQLSPHMEQINSEGMLVQKVDVDANSDLASRYRVRSIPTVVLENNGQEVGRVIGNKPKDSYINLWNSN